MMLMVMTILKLLQLEVCSQTHCTRLLCELYARQKIPQIPITLRHPVSLIPLKLQQVSIYDSFIDYAITEMQIKFPSAALQ